MPQGTYKVSGFTRKGGVKVKAHVRTKPTLSAREKQRRGSVAKKVLIPAAIKATGKKGFAKTVEGLRGKKGIKSPERLAGWLKGQAKAKGQLSPEHKYRGRAGWRKYPEAATRMSPKEYRAFLRKKRGK